MNIKQFIIAAALAWQMSLIRVEANDKSFHSAIQSLSRIVGECRSDDFATSERLQRVIADLESILFEQKRTISTLKSQVAWSTVDRLTNISVDATNVMMDKAMLETLLHRLTEEESVQQVLSVEESSLPAGENYASDVLKIRLKVVLGNGRITVRNFFLKRTLSNKIGGLFEELQVFKIETKMYTIAFKEMEYLMDEFGDTDGPLWCKLIHYEPYTSILLEDLEGCGYKLVKRQIGMDLDHGLLAIRALGRYHGFMKVLEARGIISKDYIKAYNRADRKLMEDITYPALKKAIQGIKKHWGSEWSDIAEQLLISFQQYMEMIEKSLKVKEDEFQLLNHGDCWSNNIMFKYDWRERPVSVRFLDFQACHYHSPCMDISNFLYFSVQPIVRRLNYCSFLENYHESLISTLIKYSYEGPKPSLAQISDVMERLELFWTYTFVIWNPMVTSESKKTFDIQKIIETKGEEGFNSDIFGETTVKERLSPDLIKLVEKYLTNPS